MAQWYYSINFESIGKAERELIKEISTALGYEPENGDECPRWECKHTAYEAYMEPILNKASFSGSITSDGEISGYSIQEWTLEKGKIRSIEEYDDEGNVVREEQYDENGTMLSTMVRDENGDLVLEAEPSLCEQFQSTKALYDMGQDGNEALLSIAMKRLREIRQELRKIDPNNLTNEEKSAINEIGGIIT